MGRNAQTYVGTRKLVENIYDAESGLLQQATYGNGGTREYEFDSKHRVTELKVDGATKFTYNYDNLGNLHSCTLPTGEKYTYLYDFLGRPVQVRSSSGFRIKLTYDEYNRASDVKFEYGSTDLTTSWVFGKSSTVYGVKYDGTEKLSYAYDSLMRRTKTTINTTTPFVTNYSYKNIDLDRTTTQLVSISYSTGMAYNYTYDANGNITSIGHPAGYELVHYHYDALNQLVREDNYELNKTVTYTYDNGGNILAVKEYAYTTADTLGTVVNQKTYTYGNSEWKDLLTNYNGINITYDAIGNPKEWINGEEFDWTGGRQLSGITKGSNAISYTYNDEGIRTSKTVNGVRTDYYLNGTAIIMRKTGDNCIWYTYDENGLLTGFRYNGNEYYYLKNAQGDIIGIIDSSGAVIARYTYDAWGNHISIRDGSGNDVSNNASHIANINPFRYRGYYFDTEIGLYYLNSRYYDARVGRFVNADYYVDSSLGLLGFNQFSYCQNNPVKYIDSEGDFPWLVVLAVAAVASAIGASHYLDKHHSDGIVAIPDKNHNALDERGFYAKGDGFAVTHEEFKIAELEAGIYDGTKNYKNGSSVSFSKIGTVDLDIGVNYSKEKEVGVNASGYVAAYTIDGTYAFSVGKTEIKVYGAVHVGYLGAGIQLDFTNGKYKLSSPSAGVGTSFSIDFDSKE